jgi:hypothetical protein
LQLGEPVTRGVRNVRASVQAGRTPSRGSSPLTSPEIHRCPRRSPAAVLLDFILAEPVGPTTYGEFVRDGQARALLWISGSSSAANVTAGS